STETEQKATTSTPAEENISAPKQDLEKTSETPAENMEKPVKTEDSSEIDLNEISVHFDDLPQFEPVSLKKTKPQPEEENFPESSESKQQSQPEQPSDQASSLMDLFPTSSKVKNRNQ